MNLKRSLLLLAANLMNIIELLWFQKVLVVISKIKIQMPQLFALLPVCSGFLFRYVSLPKTWRCVRAQTSTHID